MSPSMIKKLPLIVLLAFLACTDTPSQPDSASANLIPLAVGNQWIHQRAYYDSLGNVSSTLEPDTTTIIGDTTISGLRWYYRQYSGHLFAYRNEMTGVVGRFVSPRSDDRALTLYMYPAAPGDSIPYHLSVVVSDSAWFPNSDSWFHVLSVERTITVQAGTFTCYHYRRTSGPSSWTDHYVSPGHGWIKQETFARITPRGSIYKVNSYETLSLTTK